MPINKTLQREIVRLAKREGIEPAALLAVVEIESSGQLFEQDGSTPRLLFERHVFRREIVKRAPQKLAAAERAGLTRPKWDRATQYKDQGTSKGRLALIAKARSIDVECANRSASWGVGQTMGFNAEGLGFASATLMVEHMTQGGASAQIDCMVREIKRNKLQVALKKLDWAAFAKGYNGPGYALNQYDAKLAAAYQKWLAALDPEDPETGSEPVVIPPTRAQELPSSKIQVGNAAVGGLTLAGIVATIWEEVNKASDTVINTAVAMAGKPSFWIAIAVAAPLGFVAWRRYTMRRDMGV